MKTILLILGLFIAFAYKAQQRDFSLVEINNEYILRSNFHIEINKEEIIVGGEVYSICSVKDEVYLTKKQDVAYEIVLKEESLVITTLDKQISLVYFKD